MDVEFFFQSRTAFIRYFYEAAVRPFRDTQSLIEREEEPYVPPYSEDGEPPFLSEWIDADTGAQFIGRAAISMLSDALKLYLVEWSKKLHLKCRDDFKLEFKKGYWNGYRTCFEKHIGADWSESPTSLDILEQVALARNSSQHLRSLSSPNARHAKDIRSKFSNPLFVHDYARDASEEEQIALLEHWFGPELIITKETLVKAIDEAERFVAWLEPQLQKKRRS